MKKSILLLLVNVLISSSFSQTEECNCKVDLDFLNEKARKTPAYKINKKEYETAYLKALEEVETADNLFDCHNLLNQLLLSLNDNHLRVNSINKGATGEIRASSEQLESFKNSSLFNTYPKSNMDIDSLKEVLIKKQKADIEGIYYAKEYMNLGVVKNKAENNYTGIVLDPKTELWEKGEIILTLTPYGNNYMKFTGGSFSSKRLISLTERVEDGLFYTIGFKKDSTQTNYSKLMPSMETYYREELTDDITYLRAASFSSWYPELGDAESFYKTLEGTLNKKNIILDLRNNSGGGDRNSDILYKILKDYSKNNHVYVLINHNTISNGEQIAHKFRKLDNFQLFGNRTNGTITFEVKDSYYNLPCDRFIATLTTKKHSKYLQFESQGVKPDVTLDMNSNWIDQVVEYISSDN